MAVTPYQGIKATTTTTNASSSGLRSRFNKGEKPTSGESVDKLLLLVKDNPKYAKLIKEIEKDKTPKLSLLQRTGEALGILSTGNAAYKALETDSLTEGVKQYGRDIARRAKTVVTGRRDEGAEAEKTYKDVLTKVGFKDTKGKIDFTDVAGFGLDVLADPSTLFGGEIVKGIGKGLKPVGSAAKWVVKKIPFADDVIAGIDDAVSKAFKPASENVIKDLRAYGADDLANAFEDINTQYTKGGSLTIRNGLSGMSKIEKEIAKKIKPENLSKIADVVESGVKTGDAIIDEQADLLSQFYKKRREMVKEVGLDIGKIDDYMPHVATNEFLEAQTKKLRNPSSVSREIRTKLDPGMERNFTSWIDDSGERVFGNIERYGIERVDGQLIKDGKILNEVPVSIKEANEWSMKELGVKMFEDNPYKAQSKYFIDTEKAIQTKKYFDNLKKIGTVGEKPFIDPDTGLRMVQSTIPELKGTLLPEEIVKYVERAKSALTTDEGTAAMLKFYDDAMNVWKGSVYGWFPSSHTTNAIGGLFHNYIAGVVEPKWYMNAHKVLNDIEFDDIIRAGKDKGSKITSKQLLEELDKYGVVGSSAYLDVPTNLTREASEAGVMNKLKKFADAPGVVSQKVEDNLRAPMYLHARIKLGLSPTEAAKRVVKFHFDYTPNGLSEFEKKFMKRLIPFYTFTRNVVPMTIQQMLLNPGKYGAVFKLQKATGLTPEDEEYKYLPKYLQQQITLRTKNKLIAGFKLPFEEAIGFAETPGRKVLSSTSPFFKIPLEVIMGKNIFKDIDIEKDTKGNAYKNAPQFIKDFLEYTEVEVPANKKTGKDGYTIYYVNPFKKYGMENFPYTSRLLNTVLRVANGDSNVEKFSTIITAIKTYDPEADKNKSYYEKELLLELQDKLERLGTGYSYENFVIPKEKKDIGNITPPTLLK